MGGDASPVRALGHPRRLHGRQHRSELRAGNGTPQERAEQFLEQIEPVLPGISAQWNRRATVDFWLDYPWTLGSYSYWKVGQ
jgi:monoamine oxidase